MRISRSPTCLLCARLLKPHIGKYGPFWGCTNYPSCSFTIPVKETDDSPYFCKICGSTLKLRKGVKGDFYGCTSYPKCLFKIKKDDIENEEICSLDKTVNQKLEDILNRKNPTNHSTQISDQNENDE